MEVEKTKREMAEAAFLRGEAAFCKGRYQDTVTELTRCLTMEKSNEYQYIETESYNMLGMLFYFSGYETIALDHYLSAYETAKKYKSTEGQVSSLLNIGLLYQGGREYDKALLYYKEAKKTAENDLRNPNMLLTLYAEIQIAQLYCRQGQYEAAAQINREIEQYYSAAAAGQFILSKCLLEIYLEEYRGNKKKVNELLGILIRYMAQDEYFMEQIDFYMELCEYLLEIGRKQECRKMLDILQEKLRPTEFLKLRLLLEKMEVDYKKAYSEKEEYLEACKYFMILYAEYEQILKTFRRQNLENVESLQKLEVHKREMEKRSKCDLATGLLNKKAFQYEVEQYLTERGGHVMDAMAFVDIDDFKLVNDSFGHLLGDEVIRAISDLIQTEFAEDCICGRFGGDEFLIFIKEIKDMSEIEEKIENFRIAFGNLGFGKTGDVHLTLSIGVSYNKSMKASYQAMVACADEALEKAKEYGKNRVTFYEIKRGIYNYG